MALYRIRYPGGDTFSLKGTFALYDLSPNLVPGVDLGGDKPIVILDHRAIVELDGKQVYHPRRNLDGLDPDIRKWLTKHPEW